ncbi:MAG: hypothetical protein LBL75_01920 [Rickettsiales bacterium]|jgi:hypothetical protein|nr:hypothetical protein [Rickettsiales bacterium]
MIDYSDIFLEVKNNIALLCDDAMDSRGCAFSADRAIGAGARAVSVAYDTTSQMWRWLEKSNVKIWSRYVVPQDFDIKQVVGDIYSMYRAGAYGVHIFVAPDVLGKLTTELKPVAPDLFFNHGAVFVSDISAIPPIGWGTRCADINDIDGAGQGLVLSDKDVDIANFYGMLMAENFSPARELHIFSSAPKQIEGVWRLVKKLHPDAVKQILFFV